MRSASVAPTKSDDFFEDGIDKKIGVWYTNPIIMALCVGMEKT